MRKLLVDHHELLKPGGRYSCAEYLLTPEHPMRTPTDKISVDDKGLPDADKFFATNRAEAPAYRRSVCPAPLDDEVPRWTHLSPRKKQSGCGVMKTTCVYGACASVVPPSNETRKEARR